MARTIDTLDALMGRIIDLDQRKYDLIGDTRVMNADASDGNLRIAVDANGSGVNTFDVNDYMRGQIATDLGIPKRYFDRMLTDAPALLTRNVDHWLHNEPNRRMLRGFKGDDGLTGRAWLSDRYRRLDYIEVARQLLPEFGNLGTEVRFHQAAVTDTRLYIRAVLPRIEGQVKVGETVQWGVQISNSEVGAGTLAIHGFLLVLACTNGMTVDTVLKQRHVGRRIEDDGVLSDEALQADDTAFWLAARDMLRAAVSETRFEAVIEKLREAANSDTIARPLRATEVLQQQMSLTDDEREAVLTHLVTGGDLSLWGALNAVTATAKQAESFERQAELEAAGWQMANMSARDWERVAVAR